MPLIKDESLSEDLWRHLADDEDLPGDGGVIVSYDRWQSEAAAFAGYNGTLGIRLRSDQAPSLIEHDLGRFEVIALEFPHQADGRAFSYARLLRERYGYSGEIRAVGRVLNDQLYFMKRCGFDSYELSSDQDTVKALEVFNDFSVAYQPAADGLAPIYRQRHG